MGTVSVGAWCLMFLKIQESRRSSPTLGPQTAPALPAPLRHTSKVTVCHCQDPLFGNQNTSIVMLSLVLQTDQPWPWHCQSNMATNHPGFPKLGWQHICISLRLFCYKWVNDWNFTSVFSWPSFCIVFYCYSLKSNKTLEILMKVY